VDFVPADEALVWVEAVLRVFAMYGNYDMSPRGRAHSRVKHIIFERGWEWFRDEVYRMRGTLARREPISLPAPETESRSAPARPDGPGVQDAGDPELARWRLVNTRPQGQPGMRACFATVPLGDLSADQLRALGRIAVKYGDGTVRLTDQQNVLFRWVRDANVAGVHAELRRTGLAGPQAGLIGDVTSCPGPIPAGSESHRRRAGQ